MITVLAIANYRSIRDMVLPLGRLNVVTGANGSGKSNLCLLPALGRLICRAARDTQVWVVSHASRLIASLREDPGCNAIELDKVLGESVIWAADSLETPGWKWPER